MEKISYDTSEIYMITCKISGKRYIGQTKSYFKTRKGKTFYGGLEKRYKAHINNCLFSSYKNTPRLSESIIRYGIDNHFVKPLIICKNIKANYYEIKFIREYNTVYPNGLNVRKGGNNSIVDENTKNKISVSLTGKVLPREHKNKMSNSHSKNTSQGILPPRRKYSDLPKYIYHVIHPKSEGYEIRHHPQLKQRLFVAKSISIEENLLRAVKYIEENDSKNHKVLIEYQVYTDLPRYIRHVKSEKYEGFEVKYHPILKNKKWTTMKLSMESKLELANSYLN
jgi:hypothetical protein